jgi:periplasmic protein TonB
MSQNSVFDKEWIDLVFEGRNKDYGAYKLRKDDSKTTMIALFSGIALLGAAVGIPYTVGQLFPHSADISTEDHGGLTITPVDLSKEIYKMPEEQPKPETPKPETEPAAPAASAVAVQRFTPLEATSTPVPTIDIPNMDDLQNALTGQTTTPATTGGSILSNTAGVVGGNETVTTPTDTNGTGIVLAPDEKPDFPGGIAKFRQKVADNFRAPDIESQSTIKVTVSFVVEKDGSITNIKILKDPGYGAGKEAVRVLNAIKTKWKPGKVKGQPVRTAFTLPIAIQIN